MALNSDDKFIYFFCVEITHSVYGSTSESNVIQWDERIKDEESFEKLKLFLREVYFGKDGKGHITIKNLVPLSKPGE